MLFPGTDDGLEGIYKSIAKSQEALGDYKVAPEYYHKYRSGSDSVFTIVLIRQIADLQYELDEREKTIELQEAELKRQKLLGNTFPGLVILLLVIAGVVVYAYINKKHNNDRITIQNDEIARQNLVLEQHKEKLEELNKTKDKLFSVIGHDLSGPIANMRACFEMVLKDDFTDQKELREVLEMLRERSASTHNLLENLLYWLRAKRGRLKPNADNINIVDIIIDNIDITKADIEAKGLLIDLSANLKHFVYCDQDMINLVLRNLLSNAIKFTPSGGKITISVEEEDGSVRVSVADTGIGIPDENLSKIFDKSMYLTTYGVNKERGSGLGLNLCRDFVEASGGVITVDSTVGVGTTFSFVIPKGKSDEVA
jgi:signal transduction histidine kinase